MTEPGAAPDPAPPRRSAVAATLGRSPRARRRALWLGAAVCALVVVGVAWVAVTGWRARADLLQLRSAVAALRADLVAGDTAAARSDLSRAQQKASAAVSQTGGPAWWVAAHVPWVGSPFRTVRGVAATAGVLSRGALVNVVAGGLALDPQRLRIGEDTVDLERLRAAEPPLSMALTEVRAAYQQIAALSPGWFGAVASGRRSVLREMGSLEGVLADTVTAARLMPTMLGGDGPRRYLVVFEGDNEARGVGGILGGYGVLDANAGRLTFERFGTDADLERVKATVNLGSDYNALYQDGDRAYDFVANADLSPHFPYAARIWSSMWEQRFDEHLDGVLALDPRTMAAVLSVVGPVTTSDGTVLTASNVVSTLEVGVYQRFGLDTARRKAFFVEAAQAVAHAMLTRSFSATRLLRVLGQSAGEHRLAVFSADPAEEAQLAAQPIAGVEPVTTRPYAAVVVNNASGTKLDYYLHRTETYARETCAAGPARVTVRLTNDAPTSGLPDYVTRGRSWDEPHPPGTDELLVSLYGTQGSYVTRAAVDGSTQFVTNGDERGHPVTSVLVTLLAGQSRTVTFDVHEPTATGPVVLPVQPLDQPMTVRATGASC